MSKTMEIYKIIWNKMFQTHTIMMGWSPQEHKGKMFDEMQIGDYVICARGANKNKQIFFAEWFLENSHDWPYTRKLTGFVDLGRRKLSLETTMHLAVRLGYQLFMN